MSQKENQYYNGEGYADPTAYACINSENEPEKKVSVLIKALKSLIWLSGFELLNRIEIKDARSGRCFR